MFDVISISTVSDINMINHINLLDHKNNLSKMEWIPFGLSLILNMIYHIAALIYSQVTPPFKAAKASG
jgi:hypothetical protein